MAAGTEILLKRKAGAFTTGQLAAGECGIDTTNGVFYFSTDGTDVITVESGGNSGGLLFVPGRMSSAISGGHWNTTVISVIPSSLFDKTEGSEIRVITYYATATRTYKASVSHRAASGNAWDSAADLVDLTYNGGSTSISTPTAGEAIVSDWMDFELDDSKDLVVASRVSTSASGNDYYTIRGVSGSTLYRKGGTDEVSVQDRVDGYTTHASNACHAHVEVR